MHISSRRSVLGRSSRFRFALRVGSIALVSILMHWEGSRPARAQESADFKMQRVSVTAASQTAAAASSDYRTTVVLGDSSLVGAASSCNAGFRTSMGFWSVLGDLHVPIRLLLDQSPTERGSVALSWSGADPGYEVYRATSPVGIVDPANLDAVTSSCASEDNRTDSARLIFYQVVPQTEKLAGGDR